MPMNNQKFESLIDQYLKGLLNKQEVEYVENWLDSLENKEAFDTLPAQELANDKQVMYNKLTARINNHEQKRGTVIFSFSRNKFLKIAASVIIIVAAGFLSRESLLNLIAPHRSTYVAGTAGSIKKQILSDGTIVWLKGNSKLIFPLTFGHGDRKVTLQGEALFEVAKDAQHPFLIYCGSLTTKVLGTSFNIRNTGSEIAVSVLTGKISLTTGQSKELMLYANENAVYSEPQATITKAQKAGRALHELTKGTEYDMAFNDAGMRDVIQRIEKKFNVDIQLEDPAIVNNLITADMTDQSLQKTMEMISQALNLEVQIKGPIILLQPKI
ncbi:FecR family protein [Chitinophaga sp. CF118]|uniref:FecR family protein n=1 Tax=Chitinophaga sp. CF118 TaxID=1884367 RepID=UPI0008E84A0A|nr:FecR domain-containing protein [Chitinophaga sp. CF118]SFD14144.1 FecR family protein [Chitinophaga sp. CF118]